MLGQNSQGLREIPYSDFLDSKESILCRYVLYFKSGLWKGIVGDMMTDIEAIRTDTKSMRYYMECSQISKVATGGSGVD